MAVVEARDEVDAADDICGVEETKCPLLVTRDKLDTVQPLCLPSCPMVPVDLEPADPQHVHVCRFVQRWVQDPDLVDTEDPCIQMGMGGVTARECHHIWTTSHVDFVHLSPEVICGVVHAHRVPLFKTVTVDVELVAVIVCEPGEFRIILPVEDSGEEMICQLWNEVLELSKQGIMQTHTETYTLRAGSPAPVPYARS